MISSPEICPRVRTGIKNVLLLGRCQAQVWRRAKAAPVRVFSSSDALARSQHFDFALLIYLSEHWIVKKQIHKNVNFLLKHNGSILLINVDIRRYVAMFSQIHR